MDVIDEFLEVRELAALEMQKVKAEKFREHEIPDGVLL